MPELAEVETIRRDVEALFAGQAIEELSVTGARTVRRHTGPSELVERVRGRALRSTGRRGKFLLLFLDSGDAVVVHLGMSGQLLRAGRDDPLPRHTHVVFGFDGPADLRFVDPRTFGQVFVSGADVPELAHLGFDPLCDPEAAARLSGGLRARRTRLKPLLLDQRFVAGIGNMYADEILFDAGLHPDRPGSSLSAEEVACLHAAMLKVLGTAIELRGSSLADEQYRDLFGRVGSFQSLHNVYGREGSPCSRCETPIVRVKAGGRSSFYCSSCQV